MNGVTQRLLLSIAFLGGMVSSTPAEPNDDPQSRLREIDLELATLPELMPSSQSHQRIGFYGHEADPSWVVIDLGRTVEPEQVVLFPARLAANEAAASGFPAALEIEIAVTDDFTESVRLADWKEPTLGSAEFVPFLSFAGNGAAGRFLRIRILALHDDPLLPGRRYYRLGEVVVLSNGQNAALGRSVSSTASTESSRRWEMRNLTDGYFWCLPLQGRESSPTDGYQSAVHKKAVVAKSLWVEVELPTVEPLDEIHLVPAHPKDYADLPGFGFPTHFRVFADYGTPSERILLNEAHPPYPAETLPNPGTAALMFPVGGASVHRLRVACDALWRRGPGSGVSGGDFLFALAEVQAWRGGKNLAAARPVAYADASTTETWSPAALTDGYGSRHNLLDWSTWLSGIERAEQLRVERNSIYADLDRTAEVRRRRWLLIATAAATTVVLLAALYAGRMRARTTRMQAELRARIARDLHDEIGAGLSHLAIQSDLASRQLQRGELRPERLEAISQAARDTLDQMRDVIWLLAPKINDWTALTERIQSIVDRLLDGVEHGLQIQGMPPKGKPSPVWARDVLAFLKEALTNVRKHAEAGHVEVALEWSDRFLLRIEDDGCGTDLAEAAQSGGAGLENMRRRAESLQAEYEIRSRPGSGTSITLIAPIAQADAL